MTPSNREVEDRTSGGHTPGLWRNLGLSRLERVRARRAEFDSSLREALEAVDADYAQQVASGRVRLANAAPCLLEALKTVRDYVSDIVEGHIEGSAKLQFVAREDLVLIDAAISLATGGEGEAVHPEDQK